MTNLTVELREHHVFKGYSMRIMNMTNLIVELNLT